MAWLRDQGFVPPKRPPYEWLPFWLSRMDAAKDPVMAEFQGFPTVVRLPLRKAVTPKSAVEMLRSLKPHTY